MGMLEEIDPNDSHEFCESFYNAALACLVQAYHRVRQNNNTEPIEWTAALWDSRCALNAPNRIGRNKQPAWTLPVIYVRRNPFQFRAAAGPSPGAGETLEAFVRNGLRDLLHPSYADSPEVAKLLARLRSAPCRPGIDPSSRNITDTRRCGAAGENMCSFLEDLNHGTLIRAGRAEDQRLDRTLGHSHRSVRAGLAALGHSTRPPSGEEAVSGVRRASRPPSLAGPPSWLGDRPAGEPLDHPRERAALADAPPPIQELTEERKGPVFRYVPGLGTDKLERDYPDGTQQTIAISGSMQASVAAGSPPTC